MRALATSNANTIVQNLYQEQLFKDAILKHFRESVIKEVQHYCRKDTPAILRTKGKGDYSNLATFSYEQLENDMDTYMPTLWSILKAAAFNPNHSKNKKKNFESMKPAILSAGAKLIAIHSQEMNVHKQIIAVALKKGGLKKTGFKRLGKSYDTMSYNYVNQILDSYAEKFDSTIKEWKEEAEDPNKADIGYVFANDNVDWELGTRHMTEDNQNKSLHKINLIAYKNRVYSKHLPDDGPQRNIRLVTYIQMIIDMYD